MAARPLRRSWPDCLSFEATVNCESYCERYIEQFRDLDRVHVVGYMRRCEHLLQLGTYVIVMYAKAACLKQLIMFKHTCKRCTSVIPQFFSSFLHCVRNCRGSISLPIRFQGKCKPRGPLRRRGGRKFILLFWTIMLIMYCLIAIFNGSNVSCASTSTIIDIMIEEDH